MRGSSSSPRLAPDRSEGRNERAVTLGVARLPPGRRIYVVGDIHGRADLLARRLADIDEDIRRDGRTGVASEIVFLGDYIDRGPDAATVIDMLVSLTGRHVCVFLRGNHELLLPAFLHDASSLEGWAALGGLPTLVSYGLRPPVRRSAGDALALQHQLRAALPLVHRLFFAALRPRYACGDFLFVHAGVDPGRALDGQVEHDLLTIRHRFLQWTHPFTQVVVHGHTPVPRPDFRPNRIAMDTGAYATGQLAVVCIEGARAREIAPPPPGKVNWS